MRLKDQAGLRAARDAVNAAKIALGERDRSGGATLHPTLTDTWCAPRPMACGTLPSLQREVDGVGSYKQRYTWREVQELLNVFGQPLGSPINFAPTTTSAVLPPRSPT